MGGIKKCCLASRGLKEDVRVVITTESMLIVIMGVSGSGKSTVGALLASKLGWKFYDADDYHPEENKAKMAKGIPLDDQDRIPWLCLLHDLIMSNGWCLNFNTHGPCSSWPLYQCLEVTWEESTRQNTILACSALKKTYRNILRQGDRDTLSQSKPPDGTKGLTVEKALFVHLDGSREVLHSRLEERRGHFMPTILLQSQLNSLEPPSYPEHFITINIENNVSDIACHIERILKLKQ
ncbi:probable gluconokinase isoform X2 [Pleurodeles waltl]|uniref:probable gluconokinase isoform X2 n=1 Tax=Pleurodeles waltl TaxID=8319 RepID=UPI003709C17D